MSEEKTTEPTKVKTRQGSGYLRQLYSTARVTAQSTHSQLKNLTSFLVNFVPVQHIDASPLQVRTHFDETEIEGLTHSIRQHGVLQPILVIQNGDRYQVLAGERRLRAAQKAGLERIPARVLSPDDKTAHEIALRENLDRVDLHPIEEGEGYASLLQTQAYSTHEALATAFGKPKSRITECIGFSRLPVSTRHLLLQHNIRHRSVLRHLLTLSEEAQQALITQVIEQVQESQDAVSTKSPVAKQKESLPSEKRQKPFSFHIHSRGIRIDSFRWSPRKGKEALEQYHQQLKGALEQLEHFLQKIT